MAEREGTRERIYTIPENFIEGGRIFNGMFKLRNFVEAVLLTAVFVLLSFLIPVRATTARISIVIFSALPPFALGIMGVNGDPLFTFLSNVNRWRKRKSVMVFNDRSKALKKAPLEAMMETPLPTDKIIDAFAAWQDKRQAKEEDKRANTVYEFEEDSELSALYDDADQIKQKGKRKKGAANKTPAENIVHDDFPDISLDDDAEDFSFLFDGAGESDTEED